MEFRKAKETDVDTIITIATEAFQKDPVLLCMKDQCRSIAEYRRFVYTFQNIYISSLFSKGECFVAVRDYEVVGFAIIEPPERTPINLISYLFNGGLKALKFVSILNLIRYMNLLNQIIIPREMFVKPNWYLSLIAVAPSMQGKNIGGRMIHECILPYIKKEHGELLVLLTNTERNATFYKKNDFTLCSKSKVKWKSDLFTSWIFERTVK